MTQSVSNSRKQLLPLMFEMGRLLKCEIAREGESMPSYLHVETLRFISEKGNPSMSDIADYLRIAPPSATALVNSFVKEGVLDRVTDPDDRRRVRLTLSKKGESLFAAAMHVREKAFVRVVSQLSDTDCTELARILTLITRNS